jgi:hypothetical protein
MITRTLLNQALLLAKMKSSLGKFVFNGVLYEVHAHTFSVCYCCLGWINKAIYRSVAIHSKNDYDKCHLWYIYYVTVTNRTTCFSDLWYSRINTICVLVRTYKFACSRYETEQKSSTKSLPLHFIFCDNKYAYCVYPGISKIRNKRRSYSF